MLLLCNCFQSEKSYIRLKRLFNYVMTVIIQDFLDLSRGKEKKQSKRSYLLVCIGICEK